MKELNLKIILDYLVENKKPVFLNGSLKKFIITGSDGDYIVNHENINLCDEDCSVNIVFSKWMFGENIIINVSYNKSSRIC